MLRMAGIAGYAIWMCFLTISVWAQKQTVLTGEDSLHQGLNMGTSTLIGGYGEAAFQRDFNEGVSHMNLVRTVLFVGHQFNDQIAFSLSWNWKTLKWKEGMQVEKLRWNRPT